MDTRARPTPVTTALRLCLHALLVGLLVLAALRATGDGIPHATAVVVLAGVMAALYAAGALAPVVQPHTRAAALWLAALGAVWLALLVLSPDALWVAFPLYFLQLHLLPVRWGLPAVAVTAAAAIASFCCTGRRSPRARSSARCSGRRWPSRPYWATTRCSARASGAANSSRNSSPRGRSSPTRNAPRAPSPSGSGWPGRSTTPSRRACRASSSCCGPPSVRSRADAPATAHVRRAREAAQDNLAEARRFVRALSPPDLEHGSLAAALSRLCLPDLGAGSHGAVRGQRHAGGAAHPVRGGAAAHRAVGAGQHGAALGRGTRRRSRSASWRHRCPWTWWTTAGASTPTRTRPGPPSPRAPRAAASGCPRCARGRPRWAGR